MARYDTRTSRNTRKCFQVIWQYRPKKRRYPRHCECRYKTPAFPRPVSFPHHQLERRSRPQSCPSPCRPRPRHLPSHFSLSTTPYFCSSPPRFPSGEQLIHFFESTSVLSLTWILSFDVQIALYKNLYRSIHVHRATTSHQLSPSFQGGARWRLTNKYIIRAVADADPRAYRSSPLVSFPVALSFRLNASIVVCSSKGKQIFGSSFNLHPSLFLSDIFLFLFLSHLW